MQQDSTPSRTFRICYVDIREEVITEVAYKTTEL